MNGNKGYPKKLKLELENKENNLPKDVVAPLFPDETDELEKVDLSEDAIDMVLNATSEPDNNVVDVERIELYVYHIVGAYQDEPDDTKEVSIMIDLRSLFVGQLPWLPREYISKVVFDPYHKCLALTKSGKTIAGVCFRTFPSQGFVEIAFCFVPEPEQLMGYGSGLMNTLKKYIEQRGIKNILTCAGSNAIGYFRMQGFSDNIQLDYSVYKGYIVEYIGGTLMHCQLDSSIQFTSIFKSPFNNIKRMLQEKQQEATVHSSNQWTSIFKSPINNMKGILQEKQQEATVHSSNQWTSIFIQSSNDMKGILHEEQQEVTVHQGSTCFKEDIEAIPVQSVLGVKKTGCMPKLPSNRKLDAIKINMSTLCVLLTSVLEEVSRSPLSLHFLQPVNEEDAPDYYQIVKYPMDLSTVEHRLNLGYYKTVRLFMGDMDKIFNNCRYYNAAYTVYYKDANKLEAIYKRKMRELDIWNKNIEVI